MESAPRSVASLKVISYNMHGFFQGCQALDDLISTDQPDVILLQEHWLTPAKLSLSIILLSVAQLC